MPYKDKEIGKLKHHEYYLKNREKIMARSKLRYKNNREEIKEYCRNRYLRIRVLTGEGKGHRKGKEFQKGMIPWNKGKKGSQVAWNKGKEWNTNIKNKMSIARLGKEPANKGKLSPLRGDKHWHWNGGITPLEEAIRKLFKYKEWRKAIFARDDYTCQECFTRGGNIDAHHKKQFAIILKEFLSQYNQFSPIEDKETLVRLALAYQPFWDISNGKTTCKKCHKVIKHFTHT